MYLANTVISYFFGGYCRTEFFADQRNDLVSNIESAVYVITSAVQIVILLVSRQFYIYVLCIPVGTLITNVVLRRYAHKIFPGIKATGELEDSEKKEIIKKVKALFFGTIGTVIFSSSDNIIISAFINLNMVTIYGNYYYIANLLFSITYTAFGAITSVVANKVNCSSKEETEKLFNTIHFWVCLISGIYCTGYVLLIQRFMDIWMGSRRLLDYSTVILIGILIYLLQFRRASIVLFDSQGLWNRFQAAPLIGGMVNLVTNIILVNTIGINGIVLSTILSLVIVYIPRELYVLYRYTFMKKVYSFLIENVKYMLYLTTEVVLCYFVVRMINVSGIPGFVLCGLIVVLLSGGFSYIVWHKNQFFLEGLKLVGNARKK